MMDSEGYFRCPCGWVHLAISRVKAEANIAITNAWFAEQGESRRVSMNQYTHCSRCGAPSSGFVQVTPDVAPIGVTLVACVVDNSRM